MAVLIVQALKNVARSSGGLTRWFKENWVDVKTGKPCGRQKGEKRGYPACRPSKRVSSKTPRLLPRCHQPKKHDLNVKKQVVRR